MSSIHLSPLPPQALLGKYESMGAYTDCYATDVPRPVSQSQFVEAFYTGGVFKIERLLLGMFVSRPSTDTQARQLAAGEVSTFSAWRVEDRTADELLMRAMDGRTRSWFMVSPRPNQTTRLYFGSAVVPVTDKNSSKPRMGFAFRALLGFHKLYSRILLGAARDRLANLPNEA
ncbi:MAG: hypothetical protein ABJA61_03915 [Caldimonas sp.]